MQSFKTALRSIISNKLRSFLTMLGIIIGVASVIILVSLVNGYMDSLINSFTDMGADQININVTNTPSRSMEPDEMYQFVSEHPDEFKSMTPVAYVSAKLKNKTETMPHTQIGGYSEDYMELKGFSLECGRNISFADISGSRNVAVLGYYTAWYMFGSPGTAIGETVSLNGTIYKVIGVIRRQDDTGLTAGGQDDFVWIPYSSAAKLNNQGDVSNYIISVRDVNKSTECTELIDEFLDSVYKNSNLYYTYANSSMLKEMNDMVSKMSLMLGGIAGISLLVAGVGVMNIMLVSVTERTHEIGIRKALGATRSSILVQFIIEAAVTSTIGGIMGIMLGAALTSVISGIVGFSAPPTLGAVLISFTVSVGIGIIFGYMPARRAAYLNPIEALRSE